jgi:SAM-dependent methyltransferase
MAIDPVNENERSGHATKQGFPVLSSQDEKLLIRRLRRQGIPVVEYRIDQGDYRKYYLEGRYQEEFPDYYAFNLPEKSMEHYLAAKFLDLSPGEVYIDIASEHSPVPEIYTRLFGVKSYRQDLSYPAGLHGDMIGGDAANMPIPAEFADKMALHCSFEHFEGDSDIRFVLETARVLKPGGAVCFVPLYLHEEHAVVTDPAVAASSDVTFDSNATIYCVPGWGNRHGRFYGPEDLSRRIIQNLKGLFPVLYHISNSKDIDSSCYARFAMLITKPVKKS